MDEGPGSSYVPSSPRKVLVVVGTRPEAIKLLPLVKAIRASPHMDPVVVATGQHPRVVEEVLGLAGLAPDVNLAVADPARSLNGLFCAVLTGFERFCMDTFGTSTAPVQERDYQTYPAACVVHGDTTSAAAAAVSAFHLQIPVIHVEAGLRTGNTRSPYPEELNRQIISRIAAFHLAPTDRNCENLVREGVPLNRIFVCGNTAIDALDWAAALRTPYGDPLLADLEHDEVTRVVVVTAHRRENWGAGTRADRDGRRDPRRPLPRRAVRGAGASQPEGRRGARGPALRPRQRGAGAPDGIHRVRPPSEAGLPRDHRLRRHPGGGARARDTGPRRPQDTERQEGVDAGTLRLVGTDVDAIVSSATQLLDDHDAYLAMATA